MAEATRWLDGLLLVIAANVAPWAAGRYLSEYGQTPLDGGATLRDGSRVLGDHKTWRGFIVGVLGCTVVARLLGLSPVLGSAFGALSMAADTASSFVKRRFGFEPGTEIPLVDQLPEALVPLLVLSNPLGLGFIESIAVALAFLFLDLVTIRFRHPKDRPGR